MKKLFFSSLLLLSVLFQSCSGESTKQPLNPNYRFQVVYTQYYNGTFLRVILDKKTGEQYFLVGSGTGYGLTKL